MRTRRRFWRIWLFSLFALAVSAALPVSVLADDVTNDLDQTIDADREVLSLYVGGPTGSVTMSVVPQTGDQQGGCNFDANESLTVLISSQNTGVATISPTSFTFDSCADTQVITVTPVAAGTADVDLTCSAAQTNNPTNPGRCVANIDASNTTGGNFDLYPGRFRVSVAVDSTPPVITPLVSPTAPNGNNGWYTSPVSVSFTVADPETGIQSKSAACDTTTNITTDTAGTTVTCQATNGAGLSGSNGATVKLDQTAPVITYSGNQGTYTIDDTVSITCAITETLSGVVASTCQSINQPAHEFQPGLNTVSSTATDAAGNVGQNSVSFTLLVSYDDLCDLTWEFSSSSSASYRLCNILNTAEAMDRRGSNQNLIDLYIQNYTNLVTIFRGSIFTRDEANTLLKLAGGL